MERSFDLRAAPPTDPPRAPSPLGASRPRLVGAVVGVQTRGAPPPPPRGEGGGCFGNSGWLAGWVSPPPFCGGGMVFGV